MYLLPHETQFKLDLHRTAAVACDNVIEVHVTCLASLSVNLTTVSPLWLARKLDVKGASGDVDYRDTS